ncbi:MAG: 4-hydroxy-tetrahydrodipicolinate synthase, partial [Treponemataceae bacterium]|nr:4-hydroxy-tetrahydrodipicolinate synthase [Treponemataceae bacterium]
TVDAVQYVQRAKDMGADYALVVTPYYNKPSDEGIFRHFEAVSKVGIPIIVYNIQGRTGKNINTALLQRIAELPNIAGVKEASGDINQMMDVIAKISRKRDDFSVLCGDDSLTLPILAAGGDGVISVVSNVAPSIVTEMVTKALNGDIAGAREIHYRLLPFFKAAFVDGNPTSIKYAMKVKGLPSGGMRLPLVEVNDNAKKIIENALKECGL